MTDDDGVAAAKAKFIAAAGQIDLLEPVKRHPYITAAVIGGVVAILAVGTEQLAGAAALVKGTASLVRHAIAFVDGWKKPQAETPQPAAQS